MIYNDLAKKLVRYQYVLLKEPKSTAKSSLDIARGEKRVLGYLMEIQDGVSASKLSSFMDVSTARIASILNKLEEKGIITRTTNPEDKRKIIVLLTVKGREIGEQTKNTIVNDMTKMLRKLGEYDAKEYVRIMKKIYNLSFNNDEFDDN